VSSATSEATTAVSRKRPGRGAPVRRTLNRGRILDAAAEMLTTHDPSAFSMRKLAERLGVTPMALYRWFANKDDLLSAVTERIADTPALLDLPDGPWADRAFAYAVAIRRNLLQYLPLLQIDGASRRLSATIVQHSETGLSLMLEIGYRDAAAVDAYRVLFWNVLDHVLVIDATDALPTTANSRDVVAQMTELAGPDLAVRMPNLAALLPHFTAVDPDRFFERSIRTLLAGLDAGAPDTDPRRSHGLAG
jgi:AcrR family transcriptional regulator